MKDKTIFISVCKNTIARNQKLPHFKRVGPIRVSEGKYGKPSRCFGYGIPNPEYVSVCYASPGGIDKPMPWGARVWLQITPKK